MKICYIYLQLRVSPGYPYPSLNFGAPYLNNPENFEFGSEEKATEPNKRRRKKKNCKPKSIDVTKLSSEERSEILHQIKGRRNNRELVIESFYFKDMGEKQQQSTSGMQELCFMCEEEADDRRKGESPVAGKSQADILNTFLIPHLPHASSAAPTPAKPQSFPPEEDANASSRCESAASVTSLPLDGATSPNMLHPYRSITYFSGNPAVVITRGIIQVFKSNNKVAIGDGLQLPQTDTLLMLAVPAAVNAHGVIEFTAPFCDAMIRMQVIRDRTPNQYMVLLKFVSPEAAYNCFLTLNNKPYRSDLADHICHLVFVASVEVLPAIGSSAAAVEQKSSQQQLDTLPQLPPHTTELPDCMVCLERMDESVRGVLTILCNHSFHAACLQQWEDLCCPVCRYIQTPEPYTHNKCQTCGALEDLWICLICGNVGCGRYTSEHAQLHYSQTYHNFAMSLNDDRVWDYVGDYFVHRLNQKDDGKLVEKKDGSSKDDNRDNKIFDIQLECMHLLSSQLDSQRKYWEERLAEVEAKQKADHQLLLNKHQETVEDHQQLKLKVEVLSKEKKTLSLRNTQLGTKFREALKDLGVERELNKGLMENQVAWKSKVEKLEKEKLVGEKEIVDLKEQLRDMMFYIEASKLIEGEENKDEIREGKIVIGESSKSTNKRNRKHK